MTKEVQMYALFIDKTSIHSTIYEASFYKLLIISKYFAKKFSTCENCIENEGFRAISFFLKAWAHPDTIALETRCPCLYPTLSGPGSCGVPVLRTSLQKAGCPIDPLRGVGIRIYSHSLTKISILSDLDISPGLTPGSPSGIGAS